MENSIFLSSSDNLYLSAFVFIFFIELRGEKMKYTRYDYRRKKEDKMSFVVIMLSIVLAAVLIGTLLSNMFLKTGDKGKTENGGETGGVQEKRVKNKDNIYEFILVQSGFYQKKDNADLQKEKLNTATIPFMVEEEGSFRIFAGIFNKSEYEKLKSKLDQQGLANSKVTYEVDTTDRTINILVEIMKGHLQILNALSQSNAASVKTEEYKEWLKKETEKLDKNSKNYNLAEEYIAYINSLPAEVDSSKVEEGYLHIYNIILKIGSRK